MLSIILPVFNEAQFLPRLLEQLTAFENFEIIVVDGGSSDQTCSIAKSYSVQLILSPKKSRSVQMNLGAKAATTEYLLFLHADVIVPDNFFQVLEAFMNREGDFANFSFQFDQAHWFLRFNAFFTRFTFSSFQFGDQGLLISKNLFDSLGGYDESKTLVEGQDIIRRAKKIGKFEKLPARLVVSARKYEAHGYYYLQFCYLIVFLLYRLKVNDAKIQRAFRRLLR